LFEIDNFSKVKLKKINQKVHPKKNLTGLAKWALAKYLAALAK
jgi:hypothetical protein